MRNNNKSFLFVVIMLSVFVVQVANTQSRVTPSKFRDGNLIQVTPPDSLLDNDSIPLRYLPADSVKNDSFPVDSLDEENTDSIPVDSTANNNAIDAPVIYNGDTIDMRMVDGRNMIYLYGNAKVTYRDMELTAEYIEIDANKNEIRAQFALDSIGNEFGYPVFKDAGNQFEMKRMWYNFKTKKGYIVDVITQQDEGYVTAEQTKRLDDGALFLADARYTTCEDHDHPHFYFNLTKAKVQPNKNIVTGPAYMVLEGVSLPIAIPFGFFPFKGERSSGLIMPTFEDEMSRGFGLRDGGYYFAFNDYVDMTLTGELWTKGSWGLAASSDYVKKYKYRGSFNSNYLVTKLDNGQGANTDFKLAWSHSQDPKKNPFSTLSASLNFTTSSYNHNSMNSLYTQDMVQNTKSSSINYTRRFPNNPLTISLNSTINQQSRDTSLSVTLPNMSITMSDIYPFRRKEMVGTPHWYENIRMSYSGDFRNSINNVKEYDFMKKNIIKDWKNGMMHRIPVSASFNLFKYINITPNVNYSSRWYTSSIEQEYNPRSRRLEASDTTYGFYRVYDYNMGVSMNTKVYGFYKPWGLFGNWAKKTDIRHVMSPSISFSGAPDFGKSSYGFYRDKRVRYGNPGDPYHVDTIMRYSPFQHGIFGLPSSGRTGALSLSLDNNVEAKYTTADTTKKISLIDNLRFSTSYNFLADSMNWSDLSVGMRLKLTKSYTLSLQGMFDVYTYDDSGRRINVPRWKAGKGIGRLMSTGTSFAYTLNNESLKKLFGGGKSDDSSGNTGGDAGHHDDGDGHDHDHNDAPTDQQPTSLRTKKESEGDFDADGYMLMNIPWSLSLNYSLSMSYDKTTGQDGKYNKFKNNEFGYMFTQNVGMSGTISPTKGWSFNFNTAYDFDYKGFTYMQCSFIRNLHCWQISVSLNPIGPYQSYNVTLSVNASMLKDFKYNQRSNSRDAVNWY